MKTCLPACLHLEAAAFAMPPGACDSHAHVIHPDSQSYPFVFPRSYTPPPASEYDYLHMLDQQGMSRGVLVQISVYGTDNRYLLEVLARHPDRLRGVAVVDETVTDAQLEQMHAAGIRGLRVNVLFKGGVGFDAMQRLAHRIADLGWHMQFLMDIRQLPDMLPRMQALPVPGVIDHMGHMPVSEGIQSLGMQAMLALVQDLGWWVKLSGAYRISSDFPTYSDVNPWAQELVRQAPTQLVWGSDWPHVAIDPMVNTGTLRNQLLHWLPSPSLRQQVLVDNPARLYDFPSL